MTEPADFASAHLETPIGRLYVESTRDGVRRILFPNMAQPEVRTGGSREATAHLDRCLDALGAYFDGRRKTFEDVTLCLEGTLFQLSVWRALREIPFGVTRSYGEIARAIDNPKSVRAVGLANGRNPVPIIVPCHRVIGANGSLTGFGGGLPTKKWLLTFEQEEEPTLFD